MLRVEQIEQTASKREHRECTNATRPLYVAAGEEVFECKSEKEAQSEQQKESDRRWARDHGNMRVRLIMSLTSPLVWRLTHSTASSYRQTSDVQPDKECQACQQLLIPAC